MDWFERLTGFRENGYEATRSRLEVDGERLRSRVNGRSYSIGQLDLVSLGELRHRTADVARQGRTEVRTIVADARALHVMPHAHGSLFQVASQFNLLEMSGPSVTPEHGVTGYAHDHTQGPACAIAAGAATIYRNYFAPVGEQIGQTAERQLDALADLGGALSEALARPVSSLWEMQNGYALGDRDGLAAISALLQGSTEATRDKFRSRLRIGVHSRVEVTDGEGPARNLVSQAFCSALPVGYRRQIPSHEWAHLARLVLEAAYEATLLAAVENAEQTGSSVVFLTRVGGGVFANDEDWIDQAMLRALGLVRDRRLDVRLVSYGQISSNLAAIAESFA